MKKIRYKIAYKQDLHLHPTPVLTTWHTDTHTCANKYTCKYIEQKNLDIYQNLAVIITKVWIMGISHNLVNV